MKSEYLHWLPSGNSVFELVTAGAAAIPPNSFADLVVSIEVAFSVAVGGGMKSAARAEFALSSIPLTAAKAAKEGTYFSDPSDFCKCDAQR